MSLAEVNITLNIQNNKSYPIQMNVLGNPYNPLDTANATTEYQFNFTTFTFTNENYVLIQYKAKGVSTFSTFTQQLQSQSIQGIVDALNLLNIGFFQTYTQGGQTYISTYNDNYVFGNINVYNVSSVISPNFFVGSGFSPNLIRQLAIQSGDRIIAVGQFVTYQGLSSGANITRILSDGSFDSTFNVGGVGFNSYCDNVLIQSDDKIVCIGQFLAYNGVAKNRICRLNADGSIDNTFLTGTGFVANYEWSVSKQSTEKIIIGGNFTSYDGNAVGGIVRLNTNGTYDASFTTGAGFTGGGLFRVNAIAVQTDDKVICGGPFTAYNGVGQQSIIRLTSAGVSDGTFLNLNAFAEVWALAIQPDGKILVGGSGFSTYGGNPIPDGLFRINADGTLDTTFNSGQTGFQSGTFVYGIGLQSNGKITCSGDFTTYNGVTISNGIIKLNPNGSIDTTWNAGTGLNPLTDEPTIEVLSNGTIILAGSFTSFDGISYNRIIGLI